MRSRCLTVVAAMVVCGCGAADAERGPVEVMEAFLDDEGVLQVGVASCNGDPEVTDLHEDDAEVHVEVTATTTDPGDACMDVVEVPLERPFGDRRLYDGGAGTGQDIPVSPR
jgi:hypothetical protein